VFVIRTDWNTVQFMTVYNYFQKPSFVLLQMHYLSYEVCLETAATQMLDWNSNTCYM